ncbi:MAG: hypothetical protein K6C13_06340 [Oscillospiraceae bacterium]|nr:hypothetical protein [Oscillospiraceae bacterium]
MDILNGIDAAQQRISEQNRVARQYARRSNFAAGNALQRQDEAPRADDAPKSAGKSIEDTVKSSLPEYIRTADSEKLLIMALIILLVSENADPALIIALIYIIM